MVPECSGRTDATGSNSRLSGEFGDTGTILSIPRKPVFTHSLEQFDSLVSIEVLATTAKQARRTTRAVDMAYSD